MSRRDDADDLPSTHLEDDEYDEFLAREFDAEGGLREELPVTKIILGITAILLVLAAMVLL
ncbi:MAG: hypothetical protein QNJ90_11265 [Planctomycetota bacterium]|nr:hypothetical protein [Planctomycetota bacterium]